MTIQSALIFSIKRQFIMINHKHMGFKQKYDSLLSKCVHPLTYKLKATRKRFFYNFFFELLTFSNLVNLTYEETLYKV